MPSILLITVAGLGAQRMAMPSAYDQPTPLRYPAQSDGGYYLDDLRTIPFAAIVRPVGAPRIERRAQRCGTDASPTYAVAVQRVVLVSGPANTARNFDVLAPVNDARGPRAPRRLLALSQGNYLLLGEQARGGRTALAPHRFVNPGARPTPEEVHFVVSSGTDIGGWTLVRTGAIGLPKAAAREEQILRALLQAVNAEADPGFGAMDVLSRLNVYSFRTSARRTSRGFRASAKEDRIGAYTSDDFLQAVLIPAMRNAASARTGKDKEPFLEALVKWNDHDAQAELNSMRTPSKKP